MITITITITIAITITITITITATITITIAIAITITIIIAIRQNAVPGSGINPLYAGKFQVLELWRGWEKHGFRRKNQNSESLSFALAH